MTSTAERSAERRTPLTRERVLRTAIELADEAGIDSFTMRRLAERLGVEVYVDLLPPAQQGGDPRRRRRPPSSPRSRNTSAVSRQRRRMPGGRRPCGRASWPRASSCSSIRGSPSVLESRSALGLTQGAVRGLR